MPRHSIEVEQLPEEPFPLALLVVVAVPVRALGTLGERLDSYHSQREQARLTEPAEQLAILDDFLTGKAMKAR